MKTPRDLLFEKHRHALPALDRVRRNALARAFPSPDTSGSHLLFRAAAKLWSELVLPCRQTWAGLAFAWVFIFGFALALSIDSSDRPAAAAPLSRETVVALQHQRQQLAELIQVDPTEPAEPARPKLQPRSFLMPTSMVG